MDTLRALLLGAAVDARAAWLSAAWCVGLTVVGYVSARRVYARPRRV